MRRCGETAWLSINPNGVGKRRAGKGYSTARDVTGLHGPGRAAAHATCASSRAYSDEPLGTGDEGRFRMRRHAALPVLIVSAAALVAAATPPVINEPLTGRTIFPASNWWHADV